MGLDSPGRWL